MLFMFSPRHHTITAAQTSIPVLTQDRILQHFLLASFRQKSRVSVKFPIGYVVGSGLGLGIRVGN